MNVRIVSMALVVLCIAVTCGTMAHGTALTADQGLHGPITLDRGVFPKSGNFYLPGGFQGWFNNDDYPMGQTPSQHFNVWSNCRWLVRNEYNKYDMCAEEMIFSLDERGQVTLVESYWYEDYRTVGSASEETIQDVIKALREFSASHPAP